MEEDCIGSQVPQQIVVLKKEEEEGGGGGEVKEYCLCSL